MKRCIVSVATGHYVRGLRRMLGRFTDYVMYWADQMPPGSPPHKAVPYAFKAHALEQARQQGYDLVLWADACIVPGQRSIEDVWARIEQDGYWISRNGFRNSEWTAVNTLPLLGVTPEENHEIEHVVATTFGLNIRSEVGSKALDEYLRLAKNGSFCGPWTGGIGVQHRHDQTALSVVAHKLGMQLTNPPEWFAYAAGAMDKTALVADSRY